MEKPWIQAQHQQGQGRASSPLLPPTLSALFCGHRWPSESWPFVFTECWRSYRTEQRAVVRSAQSHPCFLEEPLGGACSPNRVGSITVQCDSRRGWRPPWPASASCLSALMVTLNGVPQQPGIGGLLLLGSLLSLHRLMVLQLDCLKRRETYGSCPRGLYSTARRKLMSDGGLPRTLQRGVLGAGWG